MSDPGRIWVIDNYDSFTYNLVQYLWELGAEPEVVRNDALSVDDLAAQRPAGIVISPGPCTPDQAGISLEVVSRLGPGTPILGVCLGHQAIGQACGARVVRAPLVMHGKVSSVSHQGDGCLHGLPSPFQACRYHSLVVERESLPDTLLVTASSEDGVIMGLRHRSWPVEGVQFHPEAILTEHGHQLLGNWLRSVAEPARLGMAR